MYRLDQSGLWVLYSDNKNPDILISPTRTIPGGDPPSLLTSPAGPEGGGGREGGAGPADSQEAAAADQPTSVEEREGLTAGGADQEGQSLLLRPQSEVLRVGQVSLGPLDRPAIRGGSAVRETRRRQDDSDRDI